MHLLRLMQKEFDYTLEDVSTFLGITRNHEGPITVGEDLESRLGLPAKHLEDIQSWEVPNGLLTATAQTTSRR